MKIPKKSYFRTRRSRLLVSIILWMLVLMFGVPTLNGVLFGNWEYFWPISVVLMIIEFIIAGVYVLGDFLMGWVNRGTER